MTSQEKAKKLLKKTLKRYSHKYLLEVFNKSNIREKIFSIKTLYGWSGEQPIGKNTACRIIPILKKLLKEQ